MSAPKPRPVYTHRIGQLKISIWENTSERGRIFHTANIVRSYRDGEAWKETTAMNYDDLLNAGELYKIAFDWIGARVTENQQSAAEDLQNVAA